MVNHPNRSTQNEYPFKVEECTDAGRRDERWVQTKRFKTREAAEAYCADCAFPARIAA